MEEVPTFGLWLKRYRKWRGLTQKGLAERINYSFETIRKIEADAKRPSRQLAEKLAETLGLSAEERRSFIRFARDEAGAQEVSWPARPVWMPPEPAPVANLDEPARATARSSAPHNLPLQPTSFIGRQKVIEAVRTRLLRPDERLLTLTGPGGTGKTRLAIQVATELVVHFEHGVFFVNLAPLTDPALVIPAIAHTLGLVESGARPIAETLEPFLADKHVLLVLDNFEQVCDARLEVARLLNAAPALKILITSRAALRLRAEKEVPVPPLDLPNLGQLPVLAHFLQNEAVALFRQQAEAVRPDFQVTTANARTIAEICARLDGLPLAIELAAARIKVLPPEALLARLSEALKLLTGGPRDLPVRQQTLRATIEWSYALLVPGEQVLFARLGVFAGGCDLKAVEAVCNMDGDLPVDVLDALQSLVDKSLVQWRKQSSDNTRFTMLETIREYARECLAARDEEDAIKQRHTDYYLTLAERADAALWQGHQQSVWLDQMQEEYGNLRAGLQWALEGEDVQRAWLLAGRLWRYWYLRREWSEGRHWLEAMLAQSGDVPLPLRARVLLGAGTLARRQGDTARAGELYEESLELYERLADWQGLAYALRGMGNVFVRQGDAQRGKELHERSLQIFRELGDSQGIQTTLTDLASLLLCYFPAFAARAVELARESLTLAERLENPGGVACAYAQLGFAARQQRDYRRAMELYVTSLTLYQGIGDKNGIAWMLHDLGTASLLQGDYQEAGWRLQESLTLYHALGDKAGIAYCLEKLAVLSATQGELVRAATLMGAAQALRDATGNALEPSDRAFYDTQIAQVLSVLGERTFRSLWSEGSAMSVEQAVAYASRTPEQVLTTPQAAPAQPRPAYPFKLSEREVEVLRLLAQGLTNKQIAEKLVLSPRTVQNHLDRIYDKLELVVRTRAAATRVAKEHNLV